MMEKISQNTRQTRSTLKILGIAYINAFTTIWNSTIKQITRVCVIFLNIYIV